MATFGIDLGTTYSCIAHYDDEFQRVVVVNNQEGKPTTPSVVYINGDNECVVGERAVNRLTGKDAPRVIECAKRLLASDNLCEENDFPSYPDFRRRKLNPTTVSSLILGKLMRENIYVKDITKDTEPEVVITFPADFSLGAKARTREAGEKAGLKIIGMIEEPIAAALSYGFSEKTKNQTVLVYDLGGGTFDATILRFDENGKVSILNKYGDPRRGGIDWDNAFAHHIWQRYVQDNPQPIELTLEDFTNPSADDVAKLIKVNRFRLKAKAAKHELTDCDDFDVTCDDDGNSVNVTLEEFDQVTQDLLNSTIEPIRSLVVEAGTVDKVLLVGGSTWMRQVRRGLEEAFPQFKGNVELCDPDQAVAKGAALYAAAKSAERGGLSTPPPEVAKDITNLASKSYGLRCYRASDDVLHISNLINIGDQLPAVGEETFETRVDNQTEVEIYVYESEEKNRLAANGASLGIPLEMGELISSEAVATFNHPVPKKTPVFFRFELNEMGELHIVAKPKDGKDLEFTLRLRGTGKGNRI